MWEVGDARFIKIINLLLLLNLKIHIYEMLFKYKKFFFLQNAKSLLFYPFPFSFLPSFSSVSLSLFPCNLTVFLLQHVQKHIPNLMSNMLAILVARISCHSLNWDKNKYETILPFRIACLNCTDLYWNVYRPLDTVLVLYFIISFQQTN